MSAAILSRPVVGAEEPFTPRIKRDFLSALTHDLRAALGNIIGFAELLGRETAPVLTEHQRHHLDRLMANGLHMQSLLDSTLVLESAQRTGQMAAPRREPVDVNDAVRRAVERNAFLAGKKGITVVPELPAEPLVLPTHPTLFDRVLDNLLGNALKFSPAGATVRVAVAAGEQVTLTIADDGPGIPTDQQGKLFRRFSRTSVKPVGAPASTGLGLYLVSRIVRRLGGTVAVSSHVGRGTAFTVALPRA